MTVHFSSLSLSTQGNKQISNNDQTIKATTITILDTVTGVTRDLILHASERMMSSSMA